MKNRPFCLLKKWNICIVPLLILCAGCATLYNRQPALTDARIEPAVVHPGDSAVLSVKVSDPYKIITQVTGVVKDDKDAKPFRLLDDGVEPDKKAHDNIWTVLLDVHFAAPPGTFTILLKAMDAKGKVVQTRTRNGIRDLTQECTVTIQYADTAAPGDISPETKPKKKNK